jgi:hypothetical protein
MQHTHYLYRDSVWYQVEFGGDAVLARGATGRRW